jgi:chemotaxis protein methyltransferase CheR
MSISDQDFAFVAREVKERSGLVLTPDKAYLLETRLGPIARREGHSGIGDFLRAVRTKRDERAIAAIVDALSTNETFFFRDKFPFDLVRETIAPEIFSARGRGVRLRVWCAACSTGQEPYSLAITFEEMRAAGVPVEAEIIATDLSDRVLEKARAGVYTQFEVQRGLPITQLVKYFSKQGENWRINDRLRAQIDFRRANLLEPISGLGQFDIVFCRNVLIYFDGETKRRTLERIAGQMQEPGYLLLGGSETVMGVTDAFVAAPNKRGLYRRNAAWRKAA